MHELSIAEALLEQVEAHTPPGAAVTSVQVRIGPLRMVVQDALQMAWQALTSDTHLDGAELQLEMLAWNLRCRACGRSWQGDEPYDTCECGQAAAGDGSDELSLIAIEIVEPPAAAAGALQEAET